MTHHDAEITIRDAASDDAAAIAEIYNHYVVETVVTFEEHVVTPDEMARRMRLVNVSSLPWLVACAPKVVGYCYAARWHERSAYRFAAEVTVYLHPGWLGRGIGEAAYRELLERLTLTPIKTVIGGVALPNAASVALHEKLGFRKAAHYNRVGFKFDRWIDVGYWQRDV
jgi:phosphinothricin acetyltransferase